MPGRRPHGVARGYRGRRLARRPDELARRPRRGPDLGRVDRRRRLGRTRGAGGSLGRGHRRHPRRTPRARPLGHAHAARLRRRRRIAGFSGPRATWQTSAWRTSHRVFLSMPRACTSFSARSGMVGDCAIGDEDVDIRVRTCVIREAHAPRSLRYSYPRPRAGAPFLARGCGSFALRPVSFGHSGREWRFGVRRGKGISETGSCRER